VQYMQSLLQGLPLAAQSVTYQQPSAYQSLANTTGGIAELYGKIFGGNTPAPAAAETTAYQTPIDMGTAGAT